MNALTSERARAIQKRRRRNGTRNPRAELREIQSILLNDIRNPDTAPHIRAQCTRAFNDCEERLRILNNKPLPGQLRPDLAQIRQAKKTKPLLLPTPDSEATPAKESL